MKDKIRNLVVLQNCDNRIWDITNRKNEGPLRIKRLEEELNAIENEFQRDVMRLESLKKETRGIDKEIQDLENKIEKSNIKLSQIKSNKEYRAALKEIEDLKGVKFETEDKMIQLMENIEDLERRCLENRERQAQSTKEFEKNKDQILKEMDDLNMELDTVQTERTNVLHNIDQELLGRYLFLRERKGGQAISAVIEGVCQACHMGIPPQRYNESIKGHSLLTCPNCERIIYWGEDKHYREALERI